MNDRSTTGADKVFHQHDHAACASRALDEAEARLVAEGAKLTPVRRRTLEILLESHRAMGAYQILDRLSGEGFGRQPPVVYRALDFLVEHGLAHRVQRLNAFTACLHPGHDHRPAFLICRNCDLVAEIAAPEVHEALRTVASPSGFVVERSTIEVLGLCPACAGDDAA